MRKQSASPTDHSFFAALLCFNILVCRCLAPRTTSPLFDTPSQKIKALSGNGGDGLGASSLERDCLWGQAVSGSSKGSSSPVIAKEGCAAERRVEAQEVEVGEGHRRATGQEGGDQRRPGRVFGFPGV